MRIYQYLEFSVSVLAILALLFCLCFFKLTMTWPLGPLGLGKRVSCSGCDCFVRRKQMLGARVVTKMCFRCFTGGDTDPVYRVGFDLVNFEIL